MIGLGCMRLSTATDRAPARSRAVLEAALDAGITLLDTADAYALDDREIGHNERLIAEVLAARTLRATVVTKGGLVRPDGAWVARGRARHLEAAARASRDRLGAPIDVYLLHAVDPRTPVATSVRALARIREAGHARQIGLSNVGVHQLQQALAVAPIEVVEIELSAYKADALRSGLVAWCRDRGISVLAHRPLGGAAGVRRLERDAVISELAAQAGCSPAELALAWLQAHGTTPLPGATRVETARSAARASTLRLDGDVARRLDAHLLELDDATSAPAPSREPREVVMIMGMPAAGKTTLALDFAARGYLRLNRDERGGTLLDLSRALDRELAAGAKRVVLDNTYGTRSSRAPVIAAARRHGAAVRCLVATTPLEQAQANAVARLLEQHGRLLEPGELTKAGAIAPSVQFRYRRSYEPPQLDEGLDAIEEVAFSPRVAAAGRRALIVELDDLVWAKRPRSPDAVELVPALRDRLQRFAAADYVIAGTTWQTPPSVDERLVELLGIPIVVARCPHPAGPPVCWCRKPLPGLALALAHAHALDLSASVHVGRGPADRGFAQRAGMRYVDVADGLPDP